MNADELKDFLFNKFKDREEELKRNAVAQVVLEQVARCLKDEEGPLTSVQIGEVPGYMVIVAFEGETNRILQFKEDLTEVGFVIDNEYHNGYIKFTPNKTVLNYLTVFRDWIIQHRNENLNLMIKAFCREKKGYNGSLYDLFVDFIHYPEKYNEFVEKKVGKNWISTNPHDLIKYLQEHGGDTSTFSIEDNDN